MSHGLENKTFDRRGAPASLVDTASPLKPASSVAVILLPIMAAVLAGFLVIGLALPVLPLHVNDDLGFGTFIVGLVAGAQFAASLVSRVWAGSFADKHGAKRSVVVGLIAAAASGLLYLLSLAFVAVPAVSVTILIVGRAILGGAESFIITGGVSWGLGLVDKEHAGKAIAWIGTAMFAAMAFGGPFGTMLFASYGSARSRLSPRCSRFSSSLACCACLPWHRCLARSIPQRKSSSARSGCPASARLSPA